jgi:hypothetical protein
MAFQNAWGMSDEDIYARTKGSMPTARGKPFFLQ